MTGVWSRADGWLTWFHRWVGVALCLLFFMWFATGAVLHFVDFPSLSDTDRYAAADPIDGSSLKIPPAQIENTFPALTGLRLISVVGRPVYIVTSPATRLTAVAGDSGDRIESISAETARRAAERFAGMPATGITGPLEYDQWIVHQRFDPYRPFFRVRIKDAAGTDLYVSARTGEVLHRTRRTERIWNWCGAILHWIYFTPLRSNWSAWNQTVWWLSLVALLTSVAGTWLGVERLLTNRAAGRVGLSPFRRWMKWHHIIGLFAAALVLSWMLSGWLSMDHGRLFSTGRISEVQEQRMRGISLANIVRAATLDDERAALPAMEIDFDAVGGHPFLLSRARLSRQLWLAPSNGDRNITGGGLDDVPLLSALGQAWPGARIQAVAKDDTDALYRLAESVSPTAFGAELLLNDETTRVYVDRYTGTQLTAMDASRRSYAWTYYALHTLNFPILLRIPLLRTTVVLLLLAVGLGFSATGVVLGFLRLKRQMLVAN